LNLCHIKKHIDRWEEKEEKIDFPRANQALQVIPEVKERMGLCGESGLTLI
jgi:phage terminase small subunit